MSKEDPDAKQTDDKSGMKVSSGAVSGTVSNTVSSAVTGTTETGDKGDYFLKKVPADSIAVHYGRYASYMAHAARLLRCHEKIELSGLGTAIRTVIEISEALKRQNLGTVSKIITERYRPNDDLKQGQSGRGRNYQQNRNKSSLPKMTVTLTRGKYGLLLSGYQQKRIVSIFEKSDEKMTGKLSVKQIQDLGLSKIFHVDPHEKALVKRSQEFLSKRGPQGSLNLPEFIDYCSILVSPLLMRKAFDNACDSIVGKYEPDQTETDEHNDQMQE